MRKRFLKNWFATLAILFLLNSPSFATIDLDDDDDDRLDCGTGSSLDGLFASGGSLYIRLHVNYPEVPDVSTRDPLSFAVSSAAGNWNWGVRLQQGNSVNPANDRLFFTHIWSTAGANTRAVWRWTGATSDNVFSCLIFTYDSSSTANDPILYVDGVAAGSPTESVSPSGSPTENNTATLDVGNLTAANNSYGENIYEVAGWSTVLSSDEITKLCSSQGAVRFIPNQIQSASLKFYYTLDDVPDGTSADGDTFSDKSGNGNTCTGNDGADNVGMGAEAEPFLSYPM